MTLGGSPRIVVPAQACDSHLHVYDPRFPYLAGASLRPLPATLAEYRQLQQRLGLSRAVVVQPSSYGTDNRCTLAAVAGLGSPARAVVVVDPRIGDSELAAMHAQGARGVRLNLARSARLPDAAALRELAGRLRDFGWHLQLHLPAGHLAQLAGLLRSLPVPVVLDHTGRVPQPEGAAHESFAGLRGLLDTGRTWLKLSAPYLDSRDGSADYRDVGRLTRELIRIAPERLVWGSDWPHPAAGVGECPMPDDAQLLALLAQWADSEATFQKILVENPARLYGF